MNIKTHSVTFILNPWPLALLTNFLFIAFNMFFYLHVQSLDPFVGWTILSTVGFGVLLLFKGVRSYFEYHNKLLNPEFMKQFIESGVGKYKELQNNKFSAKMMFGIILEATFLYWELFKTMAAISQVALLAVFVTVVLYVVYTHIKAPKPL